MVVFLKCLMNKIKVLKISPLHVTESILLVRLNIKGLKFFFECFIYSYNNNK